MVSICFYSVANHEALTTIWIQFVNCLCAFREGPNDPSGKSRLDIRKCYLAKNQTFLIS